MHDALSLVEAAYRDASNERAWLQGLIDAADIVDQGLGVSALTYRSGPEGVSVPLVVGDAPVHIAHGYRLARERAAHGPLVDAVLDPDGRAEHLESAHVNKEDAAATRRVDKARGQLRRASPDEARGLWRGLVEGRWTLVDHVDQDGRRYVFARRNAPTVHAWDGLTEREKQVVVYAAHGHTQKLIAHELGLSASTVGAHLAGAARKVGVRSRVALLSAYRRDHPYGHASA